MNQEDNNKTSKYNQALLYAAKRGFRVIDGVVVSAIGLKMNPGIRDGYYAFSVRMRFGNKSRVIMVKVHRLVALQKFGDAMFADGIEVRHLDGNRLNNLESNIAIGTHSENMMDRPEKERRDHAALSRKHSDEFIQKLREDHASGIAYSRLARIHGIPKSTLSYYLSSKAKRQSYSLPISESSVCAYSQSDIAKAAYTGKE